LAGDTMMAVAKLRREPGYDYTSVPIPKPGPDDVLLRIERAAICGTDILLYEWDPLVHDTVRELPFIPGHECCGRVVEVGRNVRDILPETRVCAETHIACGHCYQCTHDLPHICRNLILFGHQVDGCFAEYAVIPRASVYPLATRLDPERACMLEPFGVSLRGVEAVEPRGDTLVVSGCGPIGLFAIGIARHQQAVKIIACEVNAYRLERARMMGADVVVGCVIEASGAPEAVNTTFSYLRKGGRIVQLGNPKGPLEVRNVIPDLMHKELTFMTLHGRRMFDTWERSEALLAGGEVDISPVISHVFPMKRVDDAMRAILAGRACKVELEPEPQANAAV